jgi:G3E family GTPase
VLRSGTDLAPGTWASLAVETGGRFAVDIPRPGLWALATQHGADEFALRLERDGQTLAPAAERAFQAAHSHEDAVTSVGITLPGEVDGDAFNAWLSPLLQQRGQDLYRSKGILNVAGQAGRFVFQGVHMLMDGRIDRPWKPGEDRTNQLVFIGRNLDRQELTEGFRRCLRPAG